MRWRGIPEHIRSDNGPEFVARQLRDWLQGLGSSPLYIASDSPWENGYCESFNGKLREECLNGEIFLLVEEGTDRDRAVAAAIQPGQTARRVGVEAPGARGLYPGTRFQGLKGSCNMSHFPWYKISDRFIPKFLIQLPALVVSEVFQQPACPNPGKVN